MTSKCSLLLIWQGKESIAAGMKLLAVCLLGVLGVLALAGVDAQSQRQLDDLWGPQVRA